MQLAHLCNSVCSWGLGILGMKQGPDLHLILIFLLSFLYLKFLQAEYSRAHCTFPTSGTDAVNTCLAPHAIHRKWAILQRTTEKPAAVPVCDKKSMLSSIFGSFRVQGFLFVCLLYLYLFFWNGEIALKPCIPHWWGWTRRITGSSEIHQSSQFFTAPLEKSGRRVNGQVSGDQEKVLLLFLLLLLLFCLVLLAPFKMNWSTSPLLAQAAATRWMTMVL